MTANYQSGSSCNWHLFQGKGFSLAPTACSATHSSGGHPRNTPRDPTRPPATSPRNRLCLAARAMLACNADRSPTPSFRPPLSLRTPCFAPCPNNRAGRSRFVFTRGGSRGWLGWAIVSPRLPRSPAGARPLPELVGGCFAYQPCGLAPCPTAPLRRSDPQSPDGFTSSAGACDNGFRATAALRNSAVPSNTVRFNPACLPLVGITRDAPRRTGSGSGVNGKMGIRWSNLLPFGILPYDSRPYSRRSLWGMAFFFRKKLRLFPP